MNIANWLPLVYLGLGSVIFVSVCQLIDLVRYRWTGLRTTGKVIRLEQQEMSGEYEDYVYTPIIEYHVDGQPRRIKSVIAIYPALYHVGQEVPVYYFQANPSNARVVTRREFAKWILVAGTCLAFLLMLMRISPSGQPQP
jgi:hypothetical protein